MTPEALGLQIRVVLDLGITKTAKTSIQHMKTTLYILKPNDNMEFADR